MHDLLSIWYKIQRMTFHLSQVWVIIGIHGDYAVTMVMVDTADRVFGAAHQTQVGLSHLLPRVPGMRARHVTADGASRHALHPGGAGLGRDQTEDPRATGDAETAVGSRSAHQRPGGTESRDRAAQTQDRACQVATRSTVFVYLQATRG